MMVATLFTLALAMAAPQGQSQSPVPDRQTEAGAELAAARALYAAANYEDALDRLGRIGTDDTLVDQVDTYRALCLLALGRSRESERVVEQILQRNPRFTLDEREVSPRLVIVYRAVRARLLPAAARNLYAAARSSFDNRQYDTAVTQLREVLALLEGDTSPDSGAADLRYLAEGFLRLAESMQTGAVPQSELQQRTVSFSKVATSGPVYSVLDREVTAPIEISRPVPIMVTPRGMQPHLYQGLVEVIISETGRVESAVMRRSINADFDLDILAATEQWRFQSAMRNGQPVKYRRSYEIIGHSR